jgi:hypothetical protein
MRDEISMTLRSEIDTIGCMSQRLEKAHVAMFYQAAATACPHGDHDFYSRRQWPGVTSACTVLARKKYPPLAI